MKCLTVIVSRWWDLVVSFSSLHNFHPSKFSIISPSLIEGLLHWPWGVPGLRSPRAVTAPER